MSSNRFYSVNFLVNINLHNVYFESFDYDTN